MSENRKVFFRNIMKRFKTSKEHFIECSFTDQTSYIISFYPQNSLGEGPKGYRASECWIPASEPWEQDLRCVLFSTESPAYGTQEELSECMKDKQIKLEYTSRQSDLKCMLFHLDQYTVGRLRGIWLSDRIGRMIFANLLAGMQVEERNDLKPLNF